MEKTEAPGLFCKRAIATDWILTYVYAHPLTDAYDKRWIPMELLDSAKQEFPRVIETFPDDVIKWFERWFGK